MKTYYEPLYKLYISVFIEEDSEKAKKKAEKIIGDDLEEISFNSQAKTIEYVSEKGGQRIVCWFRKNDLSLLAHELVHVVEYCFESRRIPFNLENTEVIAYLIERLFVIFEPLFIKKKGK